MLHATASQTAGPFLDIGFRWMENGDLLAATPAITGERMAIHGKIFDGDGAPMPDCTVEIWQADGQGRYAHTGNRSESDGFTGFGRVATDADGAFRFSTIKPGCVAGLNGTLQAPHIVVSLFSRGLLKRLATRIYFPDDAANADDPVLALIPAARRATLIATLERDATFEWNVRVQGDAETVFFDI